MFFDAIHSVILLAICILFFPRISAQLHRQLTAETAPGCGNRTEQCDFNVFYIRAVGENDTIHYLWDFSGKPSLLLAHTKPNVSIHIYWDRFLNHNKGSVTFSSPPNYSFLLMIDELIEFNDINDSGLLENNSTQISYKTDVMRWSLSQPLKPITEQGAVACEMKGSDFTRENLTLSGSVFLQLKAFGDTSHDAMLPRLLHSANSSQVKLILQDLKSNSNFTQSRWAAKLLLISSDLRNQSVDIDTRKNLDDENSPGVFTVVNVLTPDADNKAAHGAFLQWRPVVYTALTPSIGNSSDVAVMDPSPTDFALLNGTLATAVFSDQLKDMLVQSTIVSFGSSQDGFYKKTNYSSWAFLMCYGSPQTESFSMLVILVMSIGLGLPAVLILFGGIFMCARRFSRRKDELSLER